MMKLGLFKDRVLNKSIIISFLIALFFIFGSYKFLDLKLNDYQSKEILKYANVIGAIENEEIISNILDEDINEEDIKVGLEKLSQYGYFQGMSLENKWIGKSFADIKNLVMIILLLFFIMGTTILFIIVYRIFSRIDKVSEGLNNLATGKEYTQLDDKAEGAISLLYNRYNMTASRMMSWIDELDSERNLIKELLNDLSHQLKTPIASIRMNTELILDGYTNEEETKQFLINNNENIDRMKWITEGLIQLSRLEANSITINKKSTNLKDTLLEAMSSIYGKALSKKINFNVLEIQESIVKHDKKWTSESIINIIDNAIKYSETNKDINISLINSEWKSEIVIEDCGYGIKKEDIHNIFKRFYRSYDKRIQSEEGSGIGLFLSKQIIESQDGTIRVESTVDRGSKFTITFYNHILKEEMQVK